MTVVFDLRLVNPKDSFVRIFGIWVDNPPPEGWTIDLARQNTAAFKTWIQDGDAVRGSLDLSDGKHDIYVAISQTISDNLGFWTIEGSFNGVAAPTISRVDHDTIGRYQVIVSGGVVTSSEKDATLEELRDITGLNALAATKAALISVKDAILGKTSELKDIVVENKKESGIIGAASISIAAIAVVLSSRGGSRRF